MSYTHPAVQTGPGDDQIVEKHHITNPRGENDDGGTAVGARITPDPSLADAPTSWDSTPHGGWRWAGSS
jgi:hypothetical protein